MDQIHGGIACAGHWVLDRIKIINDWPEKFEQCHILSESMSGGGAPLNVALDLANLRIPAPIYGVGCIGDDPAGEHLVKLCRDHDIHLDFLKQIPNQPSSYTDVMVVESTGERTLFHYGGANKYFTLDQAPIDQLKHHGVELFYLGHLLVIEALDAHDPDYGSVAAHLLHNVQKTGMQTVVDVATENNDRYKQVVEPSLPYIDHLVINELEAERITGIKTRDDHNTLIWEGVSQAARCLIRMGVQHNAIIHMPEGGYWYAAKGEAFAGAALAIPSHYFQSTCGAGDAFCSGIIAGIYQNWTEAATLQLAIATAAASITSRDNSAGIPAMDIVNQLVDQWSPQTMTLAWAQDENIGLVRAAD